MAGHGQDSGGRVGPAVRSRLERLLFEVAVEHFEGQVVAKPIEGYRMLTRSRLVDPLSGVRAAGVLTGAVRWHLVEQATAARAAGATWDEVGDALGLPADPSEGYSEAESRGDVAFSRIVEGARPDDYWTSLRSPSTSWSCGSCGRWVTDHGPGVGSHPADQETGHADGCTRHRRDVAAWQARTGWEDE